MFLWVLALGCTGGTPEVVQHEWPEIEAGAPQAGTAEAAILLPAGTPLGGYSSRCGYLGGSSAQDMRHSSYAVGFVESTGVQSRPMAKVLWLENGQDHLVVVKVDLIYAYDGLVEVLEERLQAATGEDLDGRVIVSANHTHAAYGPFSDSYHFYLGGDRYDEEIFQRLAQQTTDLAIEAYEGLEPVALGTSWVKDWDPDDQVYRDRREDNDALVVWPDAEPGYGKDPHMNLLRVDRLDGSPLAVLFTFGIHGTSLGADNSMISSDAPGHLEMAVQEQFEEEVLVMHLQGAGGDASSAGKDENYARLESVGEAVVDPVMTLWQQTPVSDNPIEMETASRSLPQHTETIRVTRQGAVDWYYPAPDREYRADNVIYDEAGEIITPLDEFNALYGAAFCGSDAPLIPSGNIGTDVFPYSACMDVELVSWVLLGIFKLTDEWGMEEMPLPLPSSLEAGTTASLLGPLPTLGLDGTVEDRDLLVGFFPGESTAMYTEQWRRRAEAELGHSMALHVAYSQDHEGYLLIPEDWLMGGYEPNINLWGPLQAEHLMEGVLDYSAQLLGNGIQEPADPLGQWTPTVYPSRQMPERTPDTTPNAGQLVEATPETMWLPLDLEPILPSPAEVQRVSGVVHIAWQGGDPIVDQPSVGLEREVAGSWEAVLSHSGRPITEVFADILIAHTPDPLYPSEADQEHYWWAGWQAVGHVKDRLGLPLGRYRLVVRGQRATGSETHWPFETAAYEVLGDPFEVLPGSLSLEMDSSGMWAWIEGPSNGWRLVDVDGESRGQNPVRGTVTVSWSDSAGAQVQQEVEAVVDDTRSWLSLEIPADATSIVVTDEYGNRGELP